MTDVFGKNITIADGPLGRAETFEVWVGTAGATAADAKSTFLGLAQGIQNSYSQPLQRVYELGNFRSYMVSGRATGSLQITRLVGKAGTSKITPTLYSVLFLVGDNVFFKVDGSKGGTMIFKDRVTGAKWSAEGCYITQTGVGVDANGVLISENVAIEYQKLVISYDAAAATQSPLSTGPTQD